MADDKGIIVAIRENPERGFRLLMASYKEPVYWHIRRLVVNLSYIRIIPVTPLASLFQACIRLAHQQVASVVHNLDLCALLEQHDDV